MSQKPLDELPAADSHVMKHVFFPALCITLLSLVLSNGLKAMGFFAQLDRWFIETFAGNMDAPNELPDWLLWVATLVMVVGVSMAILSESIGWKRIIIALSAVFSVLSWLPVLVLAAYRVDFTAPIVCIAWAAFGSCIYAARHSPP